MAVRVRKLARQLGRTPAEVIGLLHAIGFTRYNSPEDMVADPVAGKARTAARQGVRPVPVQLESVRKPESGAEKAGGRGNDLMASLIPGVERLDGSKTAAPKRPAPPKPAPTSAKPAPPVEQTSLDEIVRLRADLDAARAARDKAEAALLEAEAARDEALAERDAARTARDEALAEADRARVAVAEAPPEVPAERVEDGLDALFEGRGLRGRDEHARALEALVAARRIEASGLVARDPAEVALLLSERVLLFDGDVPGQLSGVVGVGVSPDRADLPGAAQLGRRVERVSELLMLNGWKQIRAVGVPPRWHGYLKHQLDARVDLHLVPGGPRDAARARQDVQGVDVVWLWGVVGDEGAREAWAQAPLLVEAPDDLGKALEALVQGLEHP